MPRAMARWGGAEGPLPLGRHYGDDAASAIEASRSENVAKDACDDIVNDPVTEAIYGDLDSDDKTEFQEIDRAIKARKAKERSAALKHKSVMVFVQSAAKRRLTRTKFGLLHGCTHTLMRPRGDEHSVGS